MYNNKLEFVDCAYIKVDTEINSSFVKANDQKFIPGYTYCVRIQDIEQIIKYIKMLFAELNLPCYRVYISGFNCLPQNDVWNKEEITRHAIELNKRKELLQSNKLYIR